MPIICAIDRSGGIFGPDDLTLLQRVFEQVSKFGDTAEQLKLPQPFLRVHVTLSEVQIGIVFRPQMRHTRAVAPDFDRRLNRSAADQRAVIRFYAAQIQKAADSNGGGQKKDTCNSSDNYASSRHVSTSFE